MVEEVGFHDVKRYGDFGGGPKRPRTGWCWWRPHERGPSLASVRRKAGVRARARRDGRRRRRLLDRRETGPALRRRPGSTSCTCRATRTSRRFYLDRLRTRATSSRTSSTRATWRRPRRRWRPTTRPSSSSAPSRACSSPTRSVERLGLPSNGTELSQARRDKHEMAERAARAPACARSQELQDRRRRRRRSRGRPSATTGRSSSSRSTPPAPTACRCARRPTRSAAAFADDARPPERAAGRQRAAARAGDAAAARSCSPTRSAGTACTTSPRSGATRSAASHGNLAYDFEELLDARGEQQDAVVAVRRTPCSTRLGSASARRTPR